MSASFRNHVLPGKPDPTPAMCCKPLIPMRCRRSTITGRSGGWLAALLLFSCTASTLVCQSAQGYNIPEIREGRYQTNGVGLMAIERENIATGLAAHVINHLTEGVLKAEPVAVTLAQRLLALALNLDPRNRPALVADFQFRRGLAPQPFEDARDPAVLANLLVTRAKFLRDQEGEFNRELTAFFLAAAMEIDPENEEAVYQYLLLRRDGEEADWNILTGRGAGE